MALKIISTLFYTVFITLLIGIAGLLVGSMLPIPGNIEMKIVKSGSMEPGIPTGSLVIVKPESMYAKGDVITFGKDTKADIPTTHRIVTISDANGETTYTVKGDANEEADPNPVNERTVIGKVIFHLPYVGFVLDFARHPLGFALLIGVPAGLIILEESLTIFKEARAALRRRRRGGHPDDDLGIGGMGKDEDGAPLRMVRARQFPMDEIFAPMWFEPELFQKEWWLKNLRMHKDSYGTSTALVVGLVFMSSLFAGASGGTISYFNDIEQSIGNLLQAGSGPDFLSNVTPPTIAPGPDVGFSSLSLDSALPDGEEVLGASDEGTPPPESPPGDSGTTDSPDANIDEGSPTDESTQIPVNESITPAPDESIPDPEAGEAGGNEPVSSPDTLVEQPAPEPEPAPELPPTGE